MITPGTAGFTISATPASQPVAVGSGTSYTVNVASVGGFSGNVSLGVAGLPSGAGGAFNPTSVAAPGSSTLTVTTAVSTPTGNDTLTITGTSGSLMNSSTVTLAVNDFTVSTAPASQTVAAGNSTNYTVTIGNDNGFTGTVGLTAGGLPSGATASFNPTSVNSVGSSTLTVSTTASTPTGTNTLSVTGTSGSLAHSNTVTLDVFPPPDFSISASPASQTVTAGSNTTYTATIGALNGFGGTVSLTVSGLPTGATASYNPASVTGSGSSTLTVTTTNTTPAGTNTLTLTGTSGSLVHSATVTLVVNGVGGTWTLVNDTDAGITYSPGWSYSATRGDGDYQDDVHYTKTNGNFAKYTFTGTGVDYITETYSDDGNVVVYVDSVLQTTVELALSSTRRYQCGSSDSERRALRLRSHTIKVVKNGGTYMLVDAFGFLTGPPQPPAAPTGLTATAASSSQINLGWTASSGATSYNVKRATVSGGPYTTIATGVTSTSYNNTGLAASTAYYYVVSAVNSAGEGANSTEATATTLTPDFTISAAPASQTVTAGNGTTYTATIAAVNGFSGNVALTVSGLPTGAGGSFNPTSVSGSGSSTLTVTTATNTPVGTYTLTVTGTSGSLVHTQTVTLVFASPFSGIYEIQNVTSSQVLNQGGSLTNGSPISQWREESSPNLEFTFIATSNGYYQINSVKSGLDVVVANAATTNNAPLVQWSFGSSGDDQWKPVLNTNGTWTFYNLHSGLTLNNTGGSTTEGRNLTNRGW